MRHIVSLALGLTLLLGTARPGLAAKCSEEDPDGSKVLAARTAANAECPCNGFPNHGQYVKCVAAVANELSSGDTPSLPKSCKGAVKKCAARSTCGKPTRVTCCVTKSDGTVKCKIKKDAQRCADAGGTNGSPCTSCCDACPAPGTGPSCSPSGAFLDALE